MCLQLGFIGHHELGERTEGNEGANRIADFEASDTRSHSVDGAGVVRSRNKRKRRLLLVLAQDLEVVGEVQTRCFDSDSHSRG